MHVSKKNFLKLSCYRAYEGDSLLLFFPEHPWRKDSYKKMLAKKAHLGNEKAKEELILIKT